MVVFRSIFKSFIRELKNEHRYRVFFQHSRSKDYPWVSHQNGKVIVWCSNDYLGMSNHKEVTGAAIKAIKNNGIGSGGTRNIAGTSDSIVKLENELAEYHNQDSSIVFSSAFAANYGLLTALSHLVPELHFLSDSHNHASIIDGIRMSRNPVSIFRHNDIDHLSEILRGITVPTCIITESIFSMDGSFSPLEEIAELSKRYNSLLCVDEVHAVGLYGEKGEGLVGLNGLSDAVDITIGGFGKAFGTQGGYIVGESTLVDCVRSLAKTFIFSTSNSIPITEGTRASLRLMPTLSHERDKLFDNVDQVRTGLRDVGIATIGDAGSHIVCIPFPSSAICTQVADYAFLNGHYIQPINFPTVPKGRERLRITPSQKHSQGMIRSLVESLSSARSL